MRHFFDVVDERHSSGAERIDNVLVVHDLMKHIDRRAVRLQNLIDTVDRHVHAGTESAGVG